MEPVAKTAYYCCGVRAEDARRANPVCGDHLAARFMSAEGQAIFDRFRRFKAPNASNVARHRFIDDWLRERLRQTPDLRVIVLGAGFDTRAFRLSGGRWIELDHPALIAIKEAELPAGQAPNALERVAIDFVAESLAAKLAPWAGEYPVVVVMEGVSMYLDQGALGRTLDALARTFPGHILISDLMTARFVRSFAAGIRRGIEDLGSRFADPVDNPADAFLRAGYRQLAEVSVVGDAREWGAPAIPRWLLNTVLRRLRDGYRTYVFEAAAGEIRYRNSL